MRFRLQLFSIDLHIVHLNMSARQKLSVARSSKRDEFYTLYEDVTFELDHYFDQFKDKIIYCPCDTSQSAFVKYFLELESKGIIKEVFYTSFKDGEGTDCLSDAAIDGYKHCDIVVTNPPFSLFRPFVELLDKLNVKFILWGNNNAICYKQVSAMLIRDRIRLGYIANRTCEFEVPGDYASSPESKVYQRDGKNLVKVASITTFTNLSVNRDEALVLTKRYDDSYIKYSNFDAINCNRSSDIPIDYDGYIGVPITYLSKHDSSKFKIIGIFNNYSEMNPELGCISGELVHLNKAPWKTRGPCISENGINIPLYVRIIIKKA